MRYHYIPIQMAKMKKTDHTYLLANVKGLELSYTAGGNIKWYNYFRKPSDSFFKN